MDTQVKKKATPSEAGFTLIELMVVIVILGVLASIVAPRFLDEPQKARVIKAKMQIQGLATATKQFYLDNGFYPSTEQGLQSLIEKPSVGRIPKHYPSKGYIAKIPSDPWDNEYIYIAPGEHEPFEIISYGADGEEGGENTDADIESWDIQ